MGYSPLLVVGASHLRVYLQVSKGHFLSPPVGDSLVPCEKVGPQTGYILDLFQDQEEGDVPVPFQDMISFLASVMDAALLLKYGKGVQLLVG